MHLGEVSSPPDANDRIRAETFIFETQYTPKRQNKEVVYFNSNQYLGREFLSSDAMLAGYKQDNDRPLPGESIVEFSERKLFQSDPDRLIVQAEARLLHALAKFPQARAAMRTHSAATFGPAHMRWTSAEREWLFGCLTGSPTVEPVVPIEMLGGGTAPQLRQYLARRPDCPKHAFGSRDVVEYAPSSDGMLDSGIIETKIEPRDHTEYSMDVSVGEDETNQNFEADEWKENSNNDVPPVEVIEFDAEGLERSLESLETESEKETKAACDDSCYTSGLLDEYFLDQPDMFPLFTDGKIAHETRAELTVQESVATILRATAMKRFALAKSKLATIISEIDRRGNVDGNRRALADNNFSHVSSEELQELFEKTGTETVEAQKSLYETERSTDRVNSHLLDYSVINGAKYKQSQAELERLDKVMEDHFATLPEDTHRPDTPGGDGSYVFGSDLFDDGPIDPMFGGRNPDEYIIRGLPNGESVFE